MQAHVGVPIEVELGPVQDDPLIDVELSDPDGHTLRLPGFVGADGVARFRLSPQTAGIHTYDVTPTLGFKGARGTIEGTPYEGSAELLRRGRLRVAESGRTLEHADGTPFMWIGDTWWMGLGKRLDWPDGFARLLDDRVAKGFSVIQLVAGPLPDFSHSPEGIWHPQQANDGGWPWEPGWARLNPAYFDDVDGASGPSWRLGSCPASWGCGGTTNMSWAPLASSGTGGSSWPATARTRWSSVSRER